MITRTFNIKIKIPYFDGEYNMHKLFKRNGKTWTKDLKAKSDQQRFWLEMGIINWIVNKYRLNM